MNLCEMGSPTSIAAASIVTAVLLVAAYLLTLRRPHWEHALDTVRMSWVEDNNAQVLSIGIGKWGVLLHGKTVAAGTTLREAIDRARGEP